MEGAGYIRGWLAGAAVRWNELRELVFVYAGCDYMSTLRDVCGSLVCIVFNANAEVPVQLKDTST